VYRYNNICASLKSVKKRENSKEHLNFPRATKWVKCLSTYTNIIRKVNMRTVCRAHIIMPRMQYTTFVPVCCTISDINPPCLFIIRQSPKNKIDIFCGLLEILKYQGRNFCSFYVFNKNLPTSKEIFCYVVYVGKWKLLEIRVQLLGGISYLKYPPWCFK